MSRLAPCLLSLALLGSASALAAAPADRDAWLRKAAQHLSHQQWRQAATDLAKANALAPLEGDEAYNHACVLARMGQSQAAIRALTKALASGFSHLEQLQKDEDLASLQALPAFQKLVKQAVQAQSEQQRLYGAAALAKPYQAQLPAEQRVAGLSRLWSEAKYNFANFDLVPGLDWDALYLETLPKVMDATDTLAYYKELTKFFAKLQDGHTNVYAPDELADQLYARPAMRVHMIEGRVLVSQVTAGAPGVEGVQAGDEIVSINGQSVQAFAQAHVDPYVSASTPQDRRVRTYGYELLMGQAGESLRLGLQRPDGTTAEAVITRLSSAQRKTLKSSGTPALQWQMLPGRVAWVSLNSFASHETAEAYLKHFPEISQAEAIIFDLRRNGGGDSNVGYRVLSTLTSKGYATSQWSSRSYVPTWRAWRRLQQPMVEATDASPDPDRQFKGQVVVLTSAQTYSAAEDFTSAFKTMKRGVIFGEPTGGSTGQPLMIQLPGGGEARICTKRDRMSDGTEFVGKGIAVDVAVEQTVAGVRAGRDEVLEAAQAWLKGQRR